MTSRGVDGFRPAVPGDCPERQLWCAVLGRALHDALTVVTPIAVPEAKDRLRTRDEARHWIVRNGVDYRSACEAAGYDPDYLRTRFLALIAAAPGQPT